MIVPTGFRLYSLLLWCSAVRAACPSVGERWLPAFGNHSALIHNTAPAWVTEPRHRGTAAILESCLLTLSLCVYSILQLNVSGFGESHVSVFLRKTKWIAIALVAPEVVILSAFMQFIQARELVAALTDAHSRVVV
jgi:hypothetical protein